MNLKAGLLSVAQTLAAAEIPYACGGLAVVLHGFPRLTRAMPRRWPQLGE